MAALNGLLGLDGSRAVIDQTEIRELEESVQGQVLRLGHPDYGDARHVWNGMIDKHPALIIRCVGTADVVATVNFAREHNLLLAVRGAGHNVAGHAVCDGGIVIDLSRMKGMLVEPSKRSVRAQSGVTWGDLDRETQIHGLVTPGGEVSTTGIAGYTLSGGMGSLQRKWGLACDNLLSVEIVTADGSVLGASPTENADLFWAVRGGGGNFGVVTWFEYQLHPLGPEVYSAATVYSLDDGPAVLNAWRDYLDHASNEVTSEALFWSMPPLPDLPAEMYGMSIVIIAGLYAGSADAGERALKPLRELGVPIVDMSGRSTYVESQCAFDEFFPPGRNYYWKSSFLDELDDDLIEMICDLAADRPSPESLFALRNLGGAVSQAPESSTAFGNRGARFNLSLDTAWDESSRNEQMVAWTRRTWTALRQRSNGGVYLNFAGLGEEGEDLARAGFGRNLDRLKTIKRRDDPVNLYRGNI
ncbi:MAG: FAD-binding oxidoreductase, partial [Nitrolancea sp.]